MIKGKLAGLTIGGFAGFILLSKGMNVVRDIVRNMCEANKWKNYYKYGKEGLMVAPGYSSHTHKIDDDNELVVEDKSQQIPENQDPSQKTVGSVIADSIVNAIKDKAKGVEAAEEPLEGQTEASEMCKGCCPEECDISKEECPFNDTEKSVNVEEDEKNETVD